ncbi:E3 ubiquitin-protein ligase TRIM71-like [Physella acuta]|uniref:E3 ubiquitin-protein ligase TRIM71-like n=1 Tax=Physella acuta TaxID=109671 RepID=UPI0027DD91FF|nr:E3 ubiquitin-protein ligase TRIM71-like [Physella acuta]
MQVDSSTVCSPVEHSPAFEPRLSDETARHSRETQSSSRGFSLNPHATQFQPAGKKLSAKTEESASPVMQHFEEPQPVRDVFDKFPAELISSLTMPVFSTESIWQTLESQQKDYSWGQLPERDQASRDMETDQQTVKFVAYMSLDTPSPEKQTPGAAYTGGESSSDLYPIQQWIESCEESIPMDQTDQAEQRSKNLGAIGSQRLPQLQNFFGDSNVRPKNVNLNSLFEKNTKRAASQQQTLEESPEACEVENITYGAPPHKKLAPQQKPKPAAQDYFFILHDDQTKGFIPIRNPEVHERSPEIAHPQPVVQHVIKPTVTRPIVGARAIADSGIISAFKKVEGYVKLNSEKPWLLPWERVNKTGVDLKNTICERCKVKYRWPHLLLCCHRFCYKCMGEMQDVEQKKIQCPSCWSITPLNEKGLNGLQLDVQRCREMLQMQQTPFLCTFCSDEKQTVLFCKTCMNFLCSDCSQIHMDNLPAHELGPVTKVRVNENGEFHPTCDAHEGELVELYCRGCRVLVCRICIMNEHSGHDLCDFESAGDDAKKRVLTINAMYSTLQKGYRKQMQSLNGVRQQLEDGDKALRNEINRACNKLIEDIRGEERLAKNLANVAYEEAINTIRNLEQEADHFLQDYNLYSDFLATFVDRHNIETFIALYRTLVAVINKMSKYNKSYDSLRADLMASIRFDPNYPEFNDVVHEAFSNIKFEHSLTPDRLSPILRERIVFDNVTEQPFGHSYRYDTEVPFINNSVKGVSTTSNSEHGSHPDFIRVTTPYSRSFGQFGRGMYEFAEPNGVLYLHDGSLAVVDSKNHRLAVFRDDGNFMRIIGEPPNLPPLDAKNGHSDRLLARTHGTLLFPYRAAQCPKTRNIIVVERPPSLAISIFTFEGEFIRILANTKLSYPRGITVDENGFILIVESRTMKFFIYSQTGNEVAQSYLATHLQFPNDIAARNELIYISDNRSHCVHIFSYSLQWQGSIGNESLTYFPIGVSFNHLGQVVITDNHNTFNISVFEPDGRFVCGFKSRSKHANCYNVALHPYRNELAVTTKECKVLIFHFNFDTDPRDGPSSMN